MEKSSRIVVVGQRFGLMQLQGGSEARVANIKSLTAKSTLCFKDSGRVVANILFVILPLFSLIFLFAVQGREHLLNLTRTFRNEGTSYSVLNDSFLVRNSSAICESDYYLSLVSRLFDDAPVLLAMNIRDGGHVLPHISLEILKLTKYIRPDRLFVSIYESGSSDTTRLCLHKLANELNLRNVRHRIILNGTIVRQHRENRIVFLSRIRNEVLEPLYTGNFSAKYVAFMNDVYFCANQVVRLLLHIARGADMVCGLDFGDECLFYDTWVTRDIYGRPVRNSENCSIFESETEMSLCEQSKLIPVFSCWNGLVGINARVFTQGNIRFRSVDRGETDCAASECTLLCLDLWRSNYSRIYIDPGVKVAYNSGVFSKLFLQSNPVLNQSVVEAVWKEKLEQFLPPQYFFCEPLSPLSTRNDPNRARASWYPVWNTNQL